MKHLPLYLGLSALIGCSSVDTLATKEQRAEHYQHARETRESRAQNFVLVAHRCNGFDLPENSLEAIRACISHGVPGIEMDVRYSKDGVPVLMHDSTLDRTVAATGNVNEYSAVELKWFTLKESTARIPTLEEVLDACDDKALLYLDMKETNLLPAVQLVAKKNMLNSVYWYLTSDAQFAQVPALMQKYPALVPFPHISDEEELVGIERYGFPFQLAEVDFFSADSLIRRLRSKGVGLSGDVIPYLLQDLQLKRLWNKGITTIQTDNPKAFIDRLDMKEYLRHGN